MRALLATLSLFLSLLLPSAGEARPTRSLSGEFSGDRYVRMAQGGTTAADIVRSARCPPLCGSKKRKPKVKRGREPGWVSPRTTAKRNILQGFAETLRDAGPSKSLSGVVGPLASKVRQLQEACGIRVISAVRHTYVAGTGGRLSLHASGRAVDIAGNPSCAYANLKDWRGGYSIDYARVRHIHISWNPGGAEFGSRFRHYSGKSRRTRYARRR